MLLDEIAFLIADNTTKAIGTDLFKGLESPSAPDTCTFVHEYPGTTPQFTLGGSSTPAWENPRVQVKCRSTDYQTARNSAEALFKLFMGQTNVNIKPSSSATGVRYLTIEPMQSPFLLGQDSNERFEIVFNSIVNKSLST